MTLACALVGGILPTMLLLKPTVALSSLQPQMVLAVLIIHSAMPTGVDTVITSGSDSVHGERSLHYAGAALDFRTRELDEGAQVALRDAVRVALGGDFDVVLESDHLHVEYQPRRR